MARQARSDKGGMSCNPLHSVPGVLGDLVQRVSATLDASWRGRRGNRARQAFRQTIEDILESGVRVVRKSEWPTRDGVLKFLGNQVLINSVAWSAGLVTAGLVKNFFEVRGFANLWGLAPRNGRSLVSAADYELIVNVASYSSGLLILILVRYLILRLIAEFHALRRERTIGDRPPIPASSDLESLN
jgi:hypothetical protein